MQLINPDQYRRMAWKNGLGVTTEIARSPADGESFDWRVSIASVERDGPFSRFPGLDRILLVLEGPGLFLEQHGLGTRLAPLEPFAFSGDEATIGRLISGPIRDFNVITRRGVTRARLEVLQGGQATVVNAGNGRALLYCHAGASTVVSSDGAATVAAGATVRVDPPAGVLTVEPAAQAWAVLAVILSDDRSQPG